MYFKENYIPRTMETNSIVFFKDRKYLGFTSRPIIAAWQISTPENIGNMIRLADNVGSEEVFILGCDFQFRMSSIKKTAGLSFDNVRLVFITPEEFFGKFSSATRFVAVETCDDSTNIFTTNLPADVVFVLGNERNGLPDDILRRCPARVHIPMTGNCKSMNVSHALSVVLFEWQRQMLFS